MNVFISQSNAINLTYASAKCSFRMWIVDVNVSDEDGYSFLLHRTEQQLPLGEKITESDCCQDE